VDRSPAAARQLASRARRRVQQADAGTQGSTTADTGTTEDTGTQAGKADLVRAFLAASREGNFDALLAMLDPDIVLRADQAAIQMADQAAIRVGIDAEVRGADAVTRIFAGRAQAARPALIDGAAGLVWAPGGQPRVVFRFAIDDGKITAIDMEADPGRLSKRHITMLRNRGR
jgi:RNA polymerase sigma-70 factor (ECF subfamily)